MGNYRPLTQTEDALYQAMRDYHRAEIHAGKVAYIEEYDPETFLCSLTPQVTSYQQTDSGDIQELPWPKMEDIPVVFPGGGDAGLTYPLKPGCPVLLAFCDHDIAEVMSSDGKEPVAPENYQPSPEGACFVQARYFPEKASKAPANADDLFLYNESGDVVLKADKVRLGECEADNPAGALNKSLALTEKVDDRIDTLLNKINEIIAATAAASGLLIPGTVLPIPPQASTESTTVFTNG